MSHTVRILPIVHRDVEDALRFTLQTFGERKYEEYRALIRLAIEEIAEDPDHPRSKHRPDIHERARTFHIGRRGRRARHFLLYRIADDGVVEFARFLYDGMDLSQHVPSEYRAEPSDERSD
jgi:toxin ParE1/3/4